jgi:hypothetical protein
MTGDEVAAPVPTGEPAVEPHHRDQQKTLPKARISLNLHFGKPGDIRNCNPTFPQGLDEIVGA